MLCSATHTTPASPPSNSYKSNTLAVDPHEVQQLVAAVFGVYDEDRDGRVLITEVPELLTQLGTAALGVRPNSQTMRAWQRRVALNKVCVAGKQPGRPSHPLLHHTHAFLRRVCVQAGQVCHADGRCGCRCVRLW